MPRISLEERAHELEMELETQKRRFIDATRQSTNQLQTALFFESWIRKNPIYSAIFLAVGGYLLAKLFHTPPKNNANEELSGEQASSPSEPQIKNKPDPEAA